MTSATDLPPLLDLRRVAAHRYAAEPEHAGEERNVVFGGQILAQMIMASHLDRSVDRPNEMEVKSIHDEQGYKDVRRRLARHYDVSAQDPDLQVTDADLSGSRRLVLTHRVRNGVLLDKTEAERTLQYLAQLWGYRVKLVEQEIDGGRVLKEHEALPMP